MSKRLAFGSVMACLCVITAMSLGCRDPQGDRSDKPRVALIMKSLANEFFKTMEEGARAH